MIMIKNMMIIMKIWWYNNNDNNNNDNDNERTERYIMEISFHFFNGRNYFTLSSAFSAKSFFSKKLNSIGSKIYEHTEVQQMTPGMDLAFLIRGGPKAEIFLSCLRKR